MCIKNNRVSMYFSPRKDKDIIQELDGIEAGDYNYFIKKLIRDGIKYRKGGYNGNVEAGTTNTKAISTFEASSPASTMNMNDLLNVDVQKKEISDQEFENNFDSL